MSLTIDYIGHSSFRFSHASCGIVYLDPWIVDNPACQMTLQDITEANYICVSHGHRDHLGDAIPICLKTDAPLITTPEICAYASQHGIAYEKQSYGINIGGAVQYGDFSITMVQAYHTSEIQGNRYLIDRSLDPGSGATGFIFHFGDKHCVYYTGDTGLFGDMKLFAELYQPDLVILPVGGKYTMGTRQALKALSLMAIPKAIPCHYDTFDNQRVDIAAFQEQVQHEVPDTELIVIKPGDSYQLD